VARSTVAWMPPKTEILSSLKFMPGKKRLRGASSKEQRQYEHIKKSAQKSGRYGKRAKEVAARTVMKKHAQKKRTSKKKK
jgi:hypothetical protein